LNLALICSAHSETDVTNSWQQVAGNHDFESTNTYCKQMDSLVGGKSVQLLSDFLVMNQISRHRNGQYAAQSQLIEMNRLQDERNSRPAIPNGMPFMECMNSLGWVLLK
jgi:predicted MPP superfamily phosphohydrolase